MKANEILEGTASSRNTNDKWSAASVDIHTSSGGLQLRVRNFMNDNPEIPTKHWKDEIDSALFDINTKELSKEQRQAYMQAAGMLLSEAVVQQTDDHIEEQIMEVLDIAERLAQSMMMQYAEEYRAMIEKYAAYLIENPDKADVVVDSLKALKK